MSAIGMKVQYKSGDVVTEEIGTILNERRTVNGRTQYLVRWASGQEGWYSTSNLHF